VTQIDQFESVFQAAAKEVYRHAPIDISSVFILSDLEPAEAAAFSDRVKLFLDVLGSDVTWEHGATQDFGGVDKVVEKLQTGGHDLLVSYRNLSRETALPTRSLGDYLDVLIQQTDPPVLAVPHPKQDDRYDWAEINTDTVMVVTDHLTGDDRLVNWGVRFTEPDGRLYLTHVEDDEVFERYIGVIGKIANLDTDVAREEILKQLLKEPHDYVGSCRRALEEAKVPIAIEEVVETGHRVADYRRLVEEKNVDLLVFRTDDEDTYAMHGVSYGLAIELDRLPLLML
jgi:nucleotide-binding universal stress UspA family protein